MDKSTIPYALAVDDDPFILMDTHDILVEAGFRCHEAHTGDEAITLLGEWGAD